MDGQRVRELRLERGWNQTVLSYHSGLAQTVISEIETGKREPSSRTLRRLADAYGVGIQDLFVVEEAPGKVLAPPETTKGGASYLVQFFTRQIKVTADAWWSYMTGSIPRPNTASGMMVLWREIRREADIIDEEAEELARVVESASEEDRRRLQEAHGDLLEARDALYNRMKRLYESESRRADSEGAKRLTEEWRSLQAGTLEGHEAR